MKIKVCGMKYPDNIQLLSTLPIDFMGLIFHPKSARYVNTLDPKALDILPHHIKRTGVFVNAEQAILTKNIKKYKLDYLQLHGNESVAYCEEVKKQFDLPIIKVFNVAHKEDFNSVAQYYDIADYFLFDTKTQQHGGSGQKFDWNILEAYTGNKLFFLSGGISDEDVASINKIAHPLLYALDLNSKFELEAGLKNIKLLEQFIKQII